MPLTFLEHAKSLSQPPLCEQLKVRDIADDCVPRARKAAGRSSAQLLS
jgi:hypothetical protein